MTLLIATITPSCGYLSQDSLITDQSRVADRPIAFNVGVAGSYEGAQESAFIGDGSAPEELFGLGQCTKLTVAPHLHMVAGYTGDHGLAIQWDAMLRHVYQASDVFTLHDLGVPGMVKELGLAPDVHETFSVVHIGWCALYGRIKSYAYTSAQSWKGVELMGGHSCSPAYDTEDPDYDDLVRRWEPAADGVETELFHVKLADNIHRAFLRGRYLKGALIGGQLHTARVDAEGISVKVARAFDCGI